MPENLMSIQYLFFKREVLSPIITHFTLPLGYDFIWWRPTWGHIIPPVVRLTWRFIAWRLLFSLLSVNEHYKVLLIVTPNKRVAHYSIIFPKYFRFPFMDNHELQIGSLWTEPNYRGMGLATCAIQEILRNAPHLGQVYWYIVAKDNHASIRVAEKNGFTLYGVGRRTERWNVSLLGTFELIQRF